LYIFIIHLIKASFVTRTMDFEQLSVDNAAKLSKTNRVDKIRERKELAEEAKQAGGSGLTAALAQRATPGEAQAFVKAAASKAGGTKRARATEAPAAAQKSDADNDAARRATALARYTRYFNSPHPALREACNGRAPDPRWSADECEAALDSVRTTLNTRGVQDTCKMVLVTGAQAAEFVTMKVGINPGNRFDLEDFGAATAEACENEHFSPELAEMAAEMGPFFVMPWYMRLGTKLVKFADEYSVYNKRRRAGTLGPVVAQPVLPVPAASSNEQQRVAQPRA
jgi:hypothetical protein